MYIAYFHHSHFQTYFIKIDIMQLSENFGKQGREVCQALMRRVMMSLMSNDDAALQPQMHSMAIPRPVQLYNEAHPSGGRSPNPEAVSLTRHSEHERPPAMSIIEINGLTAIYIYRSVSARQ